VADLETLADADAANLRLQPEPVDLAEIAAVVVEATAPMAGGRGIALTRVGEPAVALADRRRIHQVVTNLVVNAIRYSPASTTVTLETGALPGGEVFVQVVDDGPGLSDDDLAHVFDRFYRGSAAAGTEGSGVGL